MGARNGGNGCARCPDSMVSPCATERHACRSCNGIGMTADYTECAHSDPVSPYVPRTMPAEMISDGITSGHAQTQKGRKATPHPKRVYNTGIRRG